MQNTTDAIAISAVASPVWLPWLYSTSEIAATLAPVLGAVWLIVQIVAKVREIGRKP